MHADRRGRARHYEMADTALLVIDMLNPYEHEDAGKLTSSVELIVSPLRALVQRAREHDDVDVIYVNDNYEDYAATSRDLVERALQGARPDLVEPIAPPRELDFLVKVRHSVFYATPLDHLLRRRGIDRLLLTGQVTEQCVLYSALDAYVRHYRIAVVRDCVAHIDAMLGAAALQMMERNMRADVVDAGALLR
jgi:nicotinamidase-related amidase